MQASRRADATDHDGAVLPTIPRLLRTWPWVTSLIAAAVVNLLIGAARHFDYRGIEGFSTTNYGWLAFTLIGGVVLGWRLAGRRRSALALVRPLIAAVAAYVGCFVLVTATGLVFLPGQSLAETITTDAPGRSLPVAEVVVVAGYLAEAVRAVVDRFRRRHDPEGDTSTRAMS